MHHAIIFTYFESGKQVSDICHNSASFYHKMHLQKTHRKTTRFPGLDGPNTQYHYSKHTK